MVLLKQLKNKKEVPFIIAVMKHRAKNNLFIYNIFKKKEHENYSPPSRHFDFYRN
jgi:hypothetical protein